MRAAVEPGGQNAAHLVAQSKQLIPVTSFSAGGEPCREQHHLGHLAALLAQHLLGEGKHGIQKVRGAVAAGMVPLLLRLLGHVGLQEGGDGGLQRRAELANAAAREEGREGPAVASGDREGRQERAAGGHSCKGPGCLQCCHCSLGACHSSLSVPYCRQQQLQRRELPDEVRSHGGLKGVSIQETHREGWRRLSRGRCPPAAAGLSAAQQPLCPIPAVVHGAGAWG
mmetsp:Transcript_1337/g.3869  ORF Transcript_1337/g.3869 Transcript_1337/m.3869 type:complete len:226 (-) Transcript_1337:999-1676(-)